MSLTHDERARTSRELQANLARSGMTPPAISAAFGWAPERFEDALHMTAAASPVDVWLLRDHLDRAIRVQGLVPVTWTILTDAARIKATGWFDLVEAPDPPQH